MSMLLTTIQLPGEDGRSFFGCLASRRVLLSMYPGSSALLSRRFIDVGFSTIFGEVAILPFKYSSTSLRSGRLTDGMSSA